MPRPAFELADIFRRSGASYRAAHALPLQQLRVMRAIEVCRTAALGGHVEQCSQCDHTRISYNSCRNRHGPKCQNTERAKWLQSRKAELLPVEYFHVVFTIPEPLARMAFYNKEAIYGILFRAASETLLTIAGDPKHLGGEIGFFAILHTWGQNLQHHPHIHCVVPGGGLSPDYERWISCRPGFLLPVRVLSRLFRRLFLEAIEKAFQQGELRFPGQLEPLAQEAAFLESLAPLRQREWVVYAKPPFGGPQQVLEYLGRYTHRVAIANQRILALDPGQVTFQWKDYRQHHKHKPRRMTVTDDEFMERRRQLMETVLENIPTGVVSLDASGAILRCNTAVNGMLGANSRDKQSLDDLLGAEASRAVQYLMRRSLRMGVVSREIETVAGGRVLHLAVTVSPLGPRRGNTGYVLVLDDLTEMLRSQKSAAWQEVARRIAHEIKNPLTPIQLSAQRLLRFLDRRTTSESKPVDTELTTLVQECSRLIEREVSTLAGLVNEFSQFVRFPTAKLVPTEANTIVQEALEVFSNRLDGVTIKTMLAENLPQVRADAGLLRSVLINLIDNAAESLEHSACREIVVSTRNRVEAESVEISVADTGHGISPEDKDKLFLPQFSTKDRGTGLGLAIAARIIAEHGGTIHAEDNHPVGSRFLIELPVTEAIPVAVGEPHAPAPESSR